MWAMEADGGRVSCVHLGKHDASLDGTMEWSGLDARGVTRFVLAGRAMLRRRYRNRYNAERAASRETRYPVALPAVAQFRRTRRICGRETLHAGEHGRPRKDSVGLVADWRAPGDVWEIPYGALIPKKVQSLLAAGRCISSAGDAWEVTRVIPAAALTGQAAGTAAAVAVEQGVLPDAVSVEKVQARLEEAGILLHVNPSRA